MKSFKASLIKIFAIAAVLLSGFPVRADFSAVEKLGELLNTKPKKTEMIDRTLYFPQPGREVSFGMRGIGWKGKEKHDCDTQNEGMPAVIVLQGPGVKVRNAYLMNALDGVHVEASDCVVENLIFPKVCEDAITANGADRLVIRNCIFRGARDKAIQLNAGRDILVENCYFEDCAKPVRVKPGVTVTVRGCVAKKSVTFVLADGAGAQATVENNRVTDSKFFVKAEKGAKIQLDDNQSSGIAEGNLAESGGRIVSQND